MNHTITFESEHAALITASTQIKSEAIGVFDTEKKTSNFTIKLYIKPSSAGPYKCTYKVYAPGDGASVQREKTFSTSSDWTLIDTFEFKNIHHTQPRSDGMWRIDLNKFGYSISGYSTTYPSSSTFNTESYYYKNRGIIPTLGNVHDTYEYGYWECKAYTPSTVTATHANIGEVTNISIVNKQIANITHTLFYSLDGGATVHQIGSAYSKDRKFTWTVPDEFYAQIPNDRRGAIYIYVDTFDEDHLQVGSRQYTTFWAYTVESDCKPTFASRVYDTNQFTLSLTGNSSVLISGYSDAAYAVNATASKYANIARVEVINGSHSQVTETGTFENVLTNDFTFYAQDTRGYGATYAVVPEMLFYIPLTCEIDAENPTTDGNMTAVIKGNYYNRSFGAVNNTLTLKYRFGVDGVYGDWITTDYTLSGNTYSKTLSFTGLDYKKAYSVQAYAVDKIKEVYSGEQTVNAVPVFDWSKKDFRVNVPTVINGDLIINGKLTNNDLEVVGNTGVYYGTCDSFDNEETKVVDCPTFIVLMEGASVRVHFDYGNSVVTTPLLNVNNTGAMPIVKYGEYTNMEYGWRSGEVKDFVFDGTHWVMVDGGVATTSDWGRTKLSNTIANDDTIALTPSAVYNLGVESGTWMPTLTASAAVSSYNMRQGWYQKIGNCVTIGFNVSVVTKSGYHGTLVEIIGAPYTPAYAAFGGGVAYNIYTPANQIFEGWAIDTSGTISIRTQTETKDSASNLTIGSDAYYTSGSANMTLAGTICYVIN